MHGWATAWVVTPRADQALTLADAQLLTPFGTVYSSNLTPDKSTGLGQWSADDFWDALHHGRSSGGRLLTPAFPYTSYTLITRSDSDALYAYLQSLPATQQANQPQGLRFPFDSQAALWIWRTLYFSPGKFQAQPGRSADWNRGAYLVQGLGHCSACHTPRNALGAERGGAAFAGAMVPEQGWYAPALNDTREAGVAQWTEADVVQLLQTGINNKTSVMGPMADVVAGSTQFLKDADARSVAAYLRTLKSPLPGAERHAGTADPRNAPVAVRAESAGAAQKLYKSHCASCYGEQGEGQTGAFPALAGNRAVLLDNLANLMRVILQGGYPPSTHGNPRPHGMPPFQQVLGDAELALLSSYVRASWGNTASPVELAEAHRAREP